MSTFDEATAVRRTGDGRYEMHPDPRFAAPATGQGPPAVNGGLLIAAMLRAVLDDSPHPHPVATNAHFLRVPAIAPARVEVTWLKHGKTAAMARASLAQDGKPMIEAMVSTGSLPAPAADGHAPAADGHAPHAPAADGHAAAADGHAPATDAPAATRPAPSWTGQPPVLSPPAECVALPRSAGFSEQVDLRLDPATAGWLKHAPGGTPQMRGWFRLRDGRDPDTYLLAFAVDALPPSVFEMGALGWAPTVELTWHMRAVPAPGLLRLAARSQYVADGWFDEESEVWDSAGRLVAQGRQLARVGRPARLSPFQAAASPGRAAGPA